MNKHIEKANQTTYIDIYIYIYIYILSVRKNILSVSLRLFYRTVSPKPVKQVNTNTVKQTVRA